MDLMEQLREKAAANPQKVAFFEADNPKMMETVGELAKAGLAECYLVGDAAVLAKVAGEVGVDLADIAIIDVTDEPSATRAMAEPADALTQAVDRALECRDALEGVADSELQLLIDMLLLHLGRRIAKAATTGARRGH